MTSTIPKYCVNQDPKNKFMQEMLSSYNDTSECSQGIVLGHLEHLLNFNTIKFINTAKDSAFSYEDENGSVILSGRQNSSDSFLIMSPNEDKHLLSLEFSGDRMKEVGTPLKRCKILSSSSLLGYISIHPPMLSLIKYDIRDTNNKVFLTVESENCFSSEFLIKASDGIKTIAKLKGNMGHLELTILDSENINLIPKVSLIALLMIMGTQQSSNGHSLNAV